MQYDLIIKNGRIVDGSGLPGFHGDVAISGGRIAEVGHVRASAKQVLDANGMVIAPGCIDNHTHYDAQVIWDPLCTFSCYHGVTTVIMGNCSLGLAPAHPYDRETLTSVLSHVEAIPIDAIRAGVTWSWETVPEYLDVLDRRLGVNVASLIGHSAVRRYVVGDASQHGSSGWPEFRGNRSTADSRRRLRERRRRERRAVGLGWFDTAGTYPALSMEQY